MNEEKIKKIAKTAIVLTMPNTKFEVNGKVLSEQEKAASISTLMIALMLELGLDTKREFEEAVLKGAKISEFNPFLAIMLTEAAIEFCGIDSTIKKANKIVAFYDSIEED
ncbi:hypothetical protein F5ESL0233_05255 [Lactobacillus sp. ESL0233]|uniref:hypothetical protein n=1 Tax=Lactobacillus sp. ESL0233 TaxID=2069354 RepID=UPI000EFBC82D|nr:hypothetical protein [Lactobacillus sp. ESL0233]RMC41726.1 hypothetical protein F5ESL0233_05255 [Lactobacillus sp. ESL0233]